MTVHRKADKPWRVKRARIKVSPKDKRTCDGLVFDSQKEMKTYRKYRLLLRHGAVTMLLRQVPFHLPGGTKYTCDFMVFWANGDVQVVDVKGHRTESYKRAKKQVEALYPVTIYEV